MFRIDSQVIIQTPSKLILRFCDSHAASGPRSTLYRSRTESTLGKGQEVEGLADSPHPPVSAISFLISLTHRALPDVLLQESAGIGCADFEPFIIPGYMRSARHSDLAGIVRRRWDEWRALKH